MKKRRALGLVMALSLLLAMLPVSAQARTLLRRMPCSLR